VTVVGVLWRVVGELNVGRVTVVGVLWRVVRELMSGHTAKFFESRARARPIKIVLGTRRSKRSKASKKNHAALSGTQSRDEIFFANIG
jgi:hypothetical protein